MESFNDPDGVHGDLTNSGLGFGGNSLSADLAKCQHQLLDFVSHA